jgi:hypothetical protein
MHVFSLCKDPALATKLFWSDGLRRVREFPSSFGLGAKMILRGDNVPCTSH